MKPLIVEKVNQIFGTGTARVHVLHDISFEVEPGTVSLIMGPSGSGKSTLLSIAGGLLTPFSGKVSVSGEPYSERTKKQREKLRLDYIGFVLQTYHLLPYLTVKDQFTLVDKVKSTGNLSENELNELLASLGIMDLIYKYPPELSGGQQQRVAIARALYPDPSVILADEPTAALDGPRVQVISDLFKSLAVDRGKSVVIVTHDSRLIDIANVIFEIKDGYLTKKEQ